MGADNPVEKIILFDGVCNLCSSTVQFVIRHNKNEELKFASLQSEFGQLQRNKFKLSPEVRTIVFIKHGKIFLRSDAVLEIAEELNGLYPNLKVLKIFPTSLRDAIYNFIAKNRYQWFGKKEQCWIPTPELANRFIQ
jgi:predicted DCC family thiol-disulfide oxidoreductase YuxK